MPYRNQQLVNGEIYHVLLRGIDNNLLFKDKDDYYRGIFSIYEFNTVQPVEIGKRREARIRFKKAAKRIGGRPTSAKGAADKRDKLVEVLAFCFMPNHIHLLLRQIKNEGITKFMVKVGSGYGRYFNKKYDRKGYVFQNRFLSVHIKDEKQLKNVFVYIHTNPAALIEPNWKEKGIKNQKKSIKLLENYKWSSYSDYIGKENFPSVTDREIILKIMRSKQDCKKFVDYWIKYKNEIREFLESTLE